MRLKFDMTRMRYHVGPPWPPIKGAYDYALALCPSDFAWEFLRRSPTYQRDYRLNCKGAVHSCRRFGVSPRLTRIRRQSRGASAWGLQSFVDPALPAPQSPVCWLAAAAAPVLEAIADRTPDDNCPDLCVRTLTSARHVVIGPAREQYVLLRDAETALTLRLHGSRASLAPVRTSILFHGLPNPNLVAKALSTLAGLVMCPTHDPHVSRDFLFLRDALIALDGLCMGASYREMAAVVYGYQEARAAWSSGSRWMKDRMCRALAKGKQLRDGGYHKLLQ
jgi:hypothetical protein